METISAIYTENNSYFAGGTRVTKIEKYYEQGQQALVPWYAV